MQKPAPLKHQIHPSGSNYSVAKRISAQPQGLTARPDRDELLRKVGRPKTARCTWTMGQFTELQPPKSKSKRMSRRYLAVW